MDRSIDRWGLRYWFDGAGAWMNHWMCTGGDWLAMLATVIPCLVMFCLYGVYALQSWRAMTVVSNSAFRRHIEDLRNVFVLCGAIHLFTHAVGWVVPLYYVSGVLMCFNCWLCTRLIVSKKVILAIQAHTKGVAAEEHLEEIQKIIHEEQHRGINASLDRLEEVIAKSKSNGNTGGVLQ